MGKVSRATALEVKLPRGGGELCAWWPQSFPLVLDLKQNKNKNRTKIYPGQVQISYHKCDHCSDLICTNKLSY